MTHLMQELQALSSNIHLEHNPSHPPYMTLGTLLKRPTIKQGHTDNLKLETPTRRVWLSRLGVEDGMPYKNQVTEERLNVHKGRWETVKTYEAK